MKILFSAAILLTCTFCACTNSPTAEYNKAVKNELAKKQRHDSLFMDIKFGMSSKEFFAYCWAMNKKGLFTDGSNNTSVMYKLDTGFTHPVVMNFYPAFHEDKINNFTATFAFEAWAPWNKPLYSDSLLPAILSAYRKWLPGNDFLTMTDRKKGTIYIKVDGNRRIIVGRSDDQNVKVDYTDLLVEQALKK